jgi:flagellin-like protein
VIVLRHFRRCDRGISELQGSLVLLAVILIAALVLKSAIGDNIAAAALDFGGFKAWGSRNDVSFEESAPSVAITEPADGSRFYSDKYTSISGTVRTAPGRNASFVYFRLNGGPWKKAELAGNSWTSSSRRYLEGSYHVEAVAYDDHGDKSPEASGTFETVFRPYPDAVFVDDDLPGTMTAGDPYVIHINFSNTGYLPWNDTAGYALSPNGSTIALPAIGMDGASVQPHQGHSFELSLIAPAAGEYTIGYRMYCPDFGWFGDEFTKTVHVVSSYHDARVVSVHMPDEMTAGETRTVSITMRNTGTAAWLASGSDPVYLAMVDGTSGDAYRFNGTSDRILMSPGSIVRNGNDYTFTFTIKAPAAGSYYTQYRMMWSNHYLFGQIAGHTITVKAVPTPTPTPTPTPGPTSNPPGQVTPTPTPATQYNAHGKMVLKFFNGYPDYMGQLRYYYDGPLGKHFERSSRGATDDSNPTWDWDIGGPNGNYNIYNDVDHYSGGLQFDMNNGGNKGRVIFYK